MNKTEKHGNLGFFSSILQRAYSNIRSAFRPAITDQQADYFPDQQLHEYMSTLRERMWQ